MLYSGSTACPLCRGGSGELLPAVALKSDRASQELMSIQNTRLVLSLSPNSDAVLMDSDSRRSHAVLAADHVGDFET